MEINALTLTTPQMAESVRFWTVPGFVVTFGGPDAAFTSLDMGGNFVNLFATDGGIAGFWGRVVLHVPSPDDVWERFRAAGFSPMTEPADARWGERYFHIKDPGGHEISFATPLTKLKR